jgi:hypothetical protein
MDLPRLRLDTATWNRLSADAEVIACDVGGATLLRVRGGAHLRVYRKSRRWFATDEAKLFRRNAARLRALGISVPLADALFELPTGERAVRFAGLGVESLRSALRRFALPARSIGDLGAMLARLHEGGVRTAALSLADFEVLADGSLGLNAPEHCRFRWPGSPLGHKARVRDLNRLLADWDGRLLDEGVRAAYEAARRR